MSGLFDLNSVRVDQCVNGRLMFYWEILQSTFGDYDFALFATFKSCFSYQLNQKRFLVENIIKIEQISASNIGAFYNLHASHATTSVLEIYIKKSHLQCIKTLNFFVLF